jgi:WD40 repeat protein
MITAETMSSAPTQMLGKYRLLKRLGEGGMAQVYQAYQPGLDRHVAIKLLHPHLAHDPEFLARFEHEAGAVARLRHPNIVQVFDFDVAAGPAGPTPYMVMEYIAGPTLKDELERRGVLGERLAPEEALRIVEALAAALDYAHGRFMVHHDVKPANVMFTAERQVVLTDFGLAHLCGGGGHTETSSTSGTPAYMAPEQAQGERGDRRSDVYSLGVVLYELITGRVPFTGNSAIAVIMQHVGSPPPSPRSATPDLPETVEQVIFKALHKQPAGRYDSAGELAEALRAALGAAADAPARAIARPATKPAQCPYRGLFAFHECDAPFFFGREEFTERLVAAVGAQPLAAVIGASGSGKSSVVYAGLLPALRQGATLRQACGQNWAIVELRPGRRPFHALARALVPLIEGEIGETQKVIDTGRLARALDQGDVLVADAAEHVALKQGAARLLLLVDQFEELFTLCTDAEMQRRFLDMLLASLGPGRNGGRLSLVLTLRADFMGQALEHRAFADALQEGALILGPMTHAELRRAIESPAAKLGVEFEAGLVERLLNDVGGKPGNLPLLEFALAALWEQAEENVLTHAAYDAIGQVDGALARHAESVYAQFGAAEQERARSVFVQLVQPGEGTEDTRRVATRTELGEERWALSQRLAGARLVVIDREVAGMETVEVVHEALLRSWARLCEWMSADRRFRAWQERLRVNLHQWEATGRDEGALLRGASLAEAEGWLAERSTELSDAECTFVEAGQALRQQRADEREAQLQRELNAAQKLAEAERQRAEEHARAAAHFVRAEAQRLAAEANVLLQTGGSAELIALLSLRSMNLQYTPQGDAALAGAGQLTYPRQVFNGRSAVFSPDGQYVLTGDAGAKVRLWHVQSGQEVRQFSTGVALVGRRAFSPDGKYMLTGGEDGFVRLWEIQTGQEVHWFQIGGRARAEFSCDGQYVMTWIRDGSTVQLWDVQTWQALRTFSLGPGLKSAELSPDNRYVLIADGRAAAKLLDVQTGQDLREFDHPGWVVENTWSAAFSSDGRQIVTGRGDKTAWVWDLQTGQVLRRFIGHSYQIQDVAFSPDGRYVLTGSDDLTARLWDAETGAELRRLTGFPAMVITVAFSPDGHALLIGSTDGAVRLWDTAASTPLPQFTGHTGGIEGLAFSPDGQYVATGSHDKTARLWDAHSGKLLQIFAGHTRVINIGLAFSPDGRYLLTGSCDKTLRLWDIRSGQTLRVFNDTAEVQGVAFSPDGKTILVGADDGSVRLWDIATGQELRCFAGHTSLVYSVAFSPDGHYVLTSSRDGTARLWDAQTGQQLRLIEVHHGSNICDARFSPDDRYVLTSDQDNSLLQLWDVQTGEEIRRIPATSPGQTAFSPDGRYVLAGLGDNTARMWELQTGHEVRRFVGHKGAVWAAAFSPDGRYVLTGSEDNTAQLWDVDYHTTMRYLYSVLRRDFTDDERAKYDIDAQPTRPEA